VKINHTPGSPIPLRPSAKRTARTAGAEAQAPRQDVTGGTVHQLPVRTDGTFDAERVAAIREEIRSGRYRIDPERIADGLIAGLQETLGRDGE
jgi:negative regulator of flagellin synthesis FlgM